MNVVTLRDKLRIESILRRNTLLHLYEIGDLDAFFWPDTKWYALNVPEPTAVALLYTAPALPVLVGLSEQPDDELRELLTLLVDQLPAHVYGHLSGNLVEILKRRYKAESHGVHIRMCLTGKMGTVPAFGPPKTGTVPDFPVPDFPADSYRVVQLTTADLPELRVFYDESYSGNWFEPRMLETGCYFGIRAGRNQTQRTSRSLPPHPELVSGDSNQRLGVLGDLGGELSGPLISVAGVHVYSARYRVAALGNVTTHPDYRGRGLAAAACARLCSALLETCDDIGLNVNIGNAAAIACYRKLGFTPVATFEEFDLTSGSQEVTAD